MLLLSVAVVCRKKEKIEFTLEENNGDHEIEKERLHLRRKTHQKNAVYLILFLMSLLVVVRVLPYYVAFIVVFVTVLYHGQTSVENGRLQFNSHIYLLFSFYWEYRRN